MTKKKDFMTYERKNKQRLPIRNKEEKVKVIGSLGF